MKRSERVLLNRKDIQEAILWLCREEFSIPSDYEFDRDVMVEIDHVDQFKDGGVYIDATIEWEDDE